MFNSPKYKHSANIRNITSRKKNQILDNVHYARLLEDNKLGQLNKNNMLIVNRHMFDLSAVVSA